MTRRVFRRNRLASAIRSCLNPATATALTVGLALASAGPAWAAMENGAPGKAALRPENVATRDEILFIDAHVADPRKLLVGVKQGVETVILEDGRSAIEQITEILENRNPSAVHLVAHGEAGRLQLGDTWLDARQLDANMALIRRWFAGADGDTRPDLLLYACNLADGVEGVAFVEKLAEISGADVAASDDLTGHADLDGDWDLEVVTGDIGTDLAFSEITINGYKSILGDFPETFTVNTTNDNDGSTEVCDEYCTLRDALYAANENGNSPAVDTVNFAFSVAKTGKGLPFDNIIYLDEEIDVTEPVNIVGLGITELAIDGEGENRIFDIESAEAVTISDMTLREGYHHEYGGCINSEDTDLTLDETYFYDCTAEEYDGGALLFYGDGDTLTIRDSFFDGHYAGESGGAIFFDDAESSGGGTLLVENSVFTNNYIDDESVGENAGGGAILAYVDETTVTIRDSDFRENYSEEAGGGAVAIIDEGDSVVLIKNSRFYENSALEESAGGGAVFVYMEGTEITVRDSTFIENYGGAYGGGAIQFWDSDEGTEASEVFIGNSYFAENYTYGPGGAILFATENDSALTIEDSQFIDNYAEEDGGGLAAYGESGDVTIRDSFFAQNFSYYDGGGASFRDLDTVSIYASTFYNNEGAEDAGGIKLSGVEYANIVNSTFSYNDAEYEGGGIQATEESDVYIRHTTIAFNNAEYGGGVSHKGEEMVIENSIVSDNTASDGPDLYGYTVDVAYSLISDTGEAGINNLGGNILGTGADLGPLTFIAGVSTPVHIPDPLSPVVDAGDPTFFVGPPAFDQRDEPRVLGASTDMGSVEQSADLSISKDDGVTSAVPGLTVIYTIVAGNDGPSDDPNVSVTDTFPASLSCGWTSVAAGGATGNTDNVGPANLSDTLSMPVSSSVTYTVTCGIDPGATGTLSNTANVGGSFDPVPGNNSATDDDTLLTPEADKTVSKTDGVTSAVPGESLVYMIVASNNGPSDDPNVSVTDTFPAALNCSWTSVAAGGATGNTNNAGPANLSDTLNMPAGSSVTYTVTCSIDPGATGTLSNTVSITGSVTDPGPGTNSATDDDTLLTPEADLSLTKVAVGVPAELMLGDVFDYVLEVSNAGPSDATNVVVTETLPPELAFVGSDCGMVEGPPGVLSWSVGTLVAGDMASCTVMVEVVNFSDLLINATSVDSDTTDTDPGNNSASSRNDGAIPTIPTLGPWGLLLLLLGLGGAGAWRLRRR